MTNQPTLVVKKITRSSEQGANELLEFKRGVNVITGQPNTGKTVWLRMLDYALGDRGSPEEAFDPALAEKYDTITVEVEINGEVVIIERSWKKRGMKTKVSVNGVVVSVDDFSSLILPKLDIPILHFPKGNPFVERRWPELSFRTLYRHIYRQSRFWGDLADAQTVSEQFACILQFLGLAEKVFSDSYGQLIEKRANVLKLQGAKDQFVKMLADVSGDLINEQEVQLSITEDSIKAAIERIEKQLQELQQRREGIIDGMVQNLSNNDSPERASEFSRISERRTELQNQNNQLQIEVSRAQSRQQELQEYISNINTEIAKLTRAQSAGRILADLKVTHCPVCDKPVEKVTTPGECILCHRPLEDFAASVDTASKRLEMELDQLRGERDEITELLRRVTLERGELAAIVRQNREEIQRIEQQLRPFQQATALIIPPEIAIIDSEIGRLQERIRQLERMTSLLNYRQGLSEEIDNIQKEVSQLQSEVDELVNSVNYEAGSDLISDGMNTYLNALQAVGLWNQDPVHFRLRERGFQVYVGDGLWSTKLGGTLTIYFLLAYHYALLNLTRQSGTHYPGLAIIDFPAKVEDVSLDHTITIDNERYVIEPFRALLSREGMENAQLIVAGNAFVGLDDIHRIELKGSWK